MFPKLKPLFAGLNENAVPASARTALAQAKTDFQLARHSEIPCYAHYTGTLPYSHSKTYRGKGYSLTMVDKEMAGIREFGPDIVLESCITGGKSYRYDEVERMGE